MSRVRRLTEYSHINSIYECGFRYWRMQYSSIVSSRFETSVKFISLAAAKACLPPVKSTLRLARSTARRVLLSSRVQLYSKFGPFAFCIYAVGVQVIWRGFSRAFGVLANLRNYYCLYIVSYLRIFMGFYTSVMPSWRFMSGTHGHSN